jgi:hypothetical protein
LHSSTLLLLISLFAVPGCGSPRLPALTRETALAEHPLLGCWALSEPQGSGFVRVPQQVRLDPVLEPWLDSTFVAHAYIDSIHRGPGAKRGYWAPYPGTEYIYVAWNDGFTGMFARVRLEGDHLEGSSFEISDAGPRTWHRGVIRGSRLDCKAPRVHGEG